MNSGQSGDPLLINVLSAGFTNSIGAVLDFDKRSFDTDKLLPNLVVERFQAAGSSLFLGLFRQLHRPTSFQEGQGLFGIFYRFQKLLRRKGKKRPSTLSPLPQSPN